MLEAALNKSLMQYDCFLFSISLLFLSHKWLITYLMPILCQITFLWNYKYKIQQIDKYFFKYIIMSLICQKSVKDYYHKMKLKMDIQFTIKYNNSRNS